MIQHGVFFLFSFIVTTSLCAERNPFFFQSYSPRLHGGVVSQNSGMSPSQNTWIEDGHERKMTFNGSISSEDQNVMLFSFDGEYYRLTVGEIAPNGMEIIGTDSQKVMLKNGDEVVSLSPGGQI